MRQNKSQIIAALDIGSTKTVVAVAICTRVGMDLIALSQVKNSGVRQGRIINMDETMAGIVEVREEAQRLAGVKLSEICLSVGGEGVQTMTSHGLVPVNGQEIDKMDIDRVLDVARTVHIPEKSRILHVLPKTFTVDGQQGIDSPMDMNGVRLEVDAQLITVSEKNLGNILTCVEKAGLTVDQIVLDQYASSLVTLEDDEKQAGVVLVGIGGGTCELIVYKNSCVSHIGTILVGGLNFTQDVAVGLKTPVDQAEITKRKYGTALVDMVGEDESIEVTGLGERKNHRASRIELSRILEARAEETLSLVFNRLNEWNVLNHAGAGVVFTGGGSLLPGLVELAEFTFDIPVRKGRIGNVIGMEEDYYNNPAFITVIGTLFSGCDQSFVSEKTKGKVLTGKTGGTWNQVKKLMSKALSI